jgi:hypothetical protein
MQSMISPPKHSPSEFDLVRTLSIVLSRICRAELGVMFIAYLSIEYEELMRLLFQV